MIVGQPEVALTKQIINETRALQGATVVYNCQVKSNPMATIDWLKDSVALGNTGVSTKQISVDQRVTIMESDLLLSNIGIKDAGNYTCRYKSFQSYSILKDVE